MANTLMNLLVKLGLDSTDYHKGLDQAEGKAQTSGKSIASGLAMVGGGAVMGGIAAVGAGIAATGVFAIKATGEFVAYQDQLNEVFTLIPGMSQDAMSAMSDDVKAFSKDFGVLPEKIVPALYQSISAGVPTDNVFAFLETAQMAAKGGVTELETAVDGISSVINAYGTDVLSAGQASDLMFTAVKLGKTNFEELSKSLFQVIPTASSLGVEFGDVTAALAAMTAQGTPTSVATTQMRQMLVELSKSTGKTSEVFQKLSGGTFKDFIASGGNVQDALQMMEQHAMETGVGVNDLFSSVEAGNAALALTGKGTETFTNNLAEMENSMGATEKAFNVMDSSLKSTKERLQARFKVFMLDAGERIAPVFEKAMATIMEVLESPGFQASIDKIMLGIVAFVDFVVANIPVVIQAFQNAFAFLQENEAIVVGILAALGVAVFAFVYMTVIPALIAMVTAFAPVLLVMAAVALVAGLLYLAWKNNFGGIQEKTAAVWAFLQPIFDTLVTWLKTNIPVAIQTLTDFWQNVLLPALQRVWSWMQTVLFPFLMALGEFLGAVLGKATEALAGLWQNVLLPALKTAGDWMSTTLFPILEELWSWIKSKLTPAFDAISGAIQGMTGWLSDMAKTIGGLKLPSWLTPGSPTPLELGLKGINREMSKASAKVIPKFTAALEMQVRAREAEAEESQENLYNGPSADEIGRAVLGAIQRAGVV